jgi:ArsR family transcriptional regulator, arsenate/arsenite/antimonite-responsive transcriptional repressor
MQINNNNQSPAYLAHLLEAIAEPTRLRILNLLQRGEFCVCELQAALQLSEPTVSRHLARLRFAYLVSAARDGARMMYRLTTADSPTLVILHRFLADVSREEPSLQQDLEYLTQRTQEKAGDFTSGDEDGAARGKSSSLTQVATGYSR